MKTTHYDISVDAADLIEDLDSLDELIINSNADIDDDDDGDASTAVHRASIDGNDDDSTAVHRASIDGTDDASTAVHRASIDGNGDASTAVHRASIDDLDDALPTPARGATRPARPPAQLPQLNLIDEDDIDWVTRLIDIVVACAGQPWRVALERIDGAHYLDQPVPHHRFAAAVAALQRVLGGRGHKAQLARACRELALGHPALSDVTRTDRIAAAARALHISCYDVERLLWADLPRERPVELPFGRPSELEVAAFANVQLIQRAVRRAQTITIAVRGDAGPLIRGASTRGLLATVRIARQEDRANQADNEADNVAVRRGASGDNSRVDNTRVDNSRVDNTRVDNTRVDNSRVDNSRVDNTRVDNSRLDDVTIIDIVGPLTLCHRTAVYGRAIASLVPLLAECSAFELTLAASGVAGPYRSRLASPVLLPSLSAKATASSSTTARLARELRRAMPSSEIVVGPPPVLVGETLVCPDIAIDRGRLYVEIVGFWTAPYLERKRVAYARAGLDVVLCVDESRGCADDVLPDNVIAFTRHVDTASIVRRLPMT